MRATYADSSAAFPLDIIYVSGLPCTPPLFMSRTRRGWIPVSLPVPSWRSHWCTPRISTTMVDPVCLIYILPLSLRVHMPRLRGPGEAFGCTFAPSLSSFFKCGDVLSSPDDGRSGNVMLSSPSHEPRLAALGPGPFVKALEHAVPGVEAHIVGKPSRAFFEAVIVDVDAHGLLLLVMPIFLPRRIRAVIGDDVEADLGGGAVKLGLERVLVRTGKYRPGDETHMSSQPDEVVDSFAAFVDSFLSGWYDREESEYGFSLDALE
ncbi:Haloacid dehalogenase-like hydrolase domain-containing protein 2 [Mycena sanguinolenta]|uniref:Haloacid dehalogenase-like hydrolase domain-containing protein 2 n=1 Tax=Mycena sanguinolenta TaxID=230812 RepID=A0A8H6Y3W4_9AGAR|nr:Haloacid dehalogenase-like hydrolase domain-containing protein 2 [Mycena sanguinolenta]